MKRNNLGVILTVFFFSTLVIMLFTGQSLTSQQDDKCYSPDVKLKLYVSSLVKGDDPYDMENVRIQIASDTNFTQDSRFESKLQSDNVEVTPEGLKPLDDQFTIYVSGRKDCKYNLRVVVIQGDDLIEFGDMNVNRIIPYEDELSINILGIPETTTEETKHTLTVVGENIDRYKIRVNKEDWIENDIEDNKITYDFDQGLNVVEAIGLSDTGEQTDIWSDQFEVKIPSQGAYPIYLGGYGLGVILNYYYYLAISHYEKSLELSASAEYADSETEKDKFERRAFEKEKLAYAYYMWASELEDRISFYYDYELPIITALDKYYVEEERKEYVTINGRSFPYVKPRVYFLVPILEKLIVQYTQAGFNALYNSKLKSAVKYFEIVILLDPYNERVLEALNEIFGTYTPEYESVFNEERNPRLIYEYQDDEEDETIRRADDTDNEEDEEDDGERRTEDNNNEDDNDNEDNDDDDDDNNN